jgi:hypothetical protein
MSITEMASPCPGCIYSKDEGAGAHVCTSLESFRKTSGVGMYVQDARAEGAICGPQAGLFEYATPERVARLAEIKRALQRIG